jgi:hypothetical protein
MAGHDDVGIAPAKSGLRSVTISERIVGHPSAIREVYMFLHFRTSVPDCPSLARPQWPDRYQIRNLETYIQAGRFGSARNRTVQESGSLAAELDLCKETCSHSMSTRNARVSPVRENGNVMSTSPASADPMSENHICCTLDDCGQRM